MCARTQTFSPAGKGTCRTPWWRGRGSKPDALGVLTGQWGSAEVPLSLWGSRGRPMAKWVRQSHRTIELFKLEKTFKIPKPTSHHACCPCPSLPHLCSPKHLQGRGLPHPKQPWQPIPVPDTSQTALWVCTELLGCLIWGTAPEDKHWVKTYIISGLKIYTFFFFELQTTLTLPFKELLPQTWNNSNKRQRWKVGWGEEHLSPHSSLHRVKLLAPGNVLCCNRVCCCQSCPQKQQLTSLTSASKSSRVSFVKAIPCLARLWVSCSASIAHTPPAEYHQLPVFKTTNINSKKTLKLQAKC